jgi:hypothetical protein
LLVDLFMAGRMPLDRLIARYGFANFNRAAADVTSGAAIKALVLLPSDNGGGDFADAFRTVIVSRKPYLIDANTI